MRWKNSWHSLTVKRKLAWGTGFTLPCCMTADAVTKKFWVFGWKTSVRLIQIDTFKCRNNYFIGISSLYRYWYKLDILATDSTGAKLNVKTQRSDKGAGERFEDGSHILHVNGAYRGDTPIGRLMHDFSCTGHKGYVLRNPGKQGEIFQGKLGGNRDLCLSNKYHSLFIHSR